MRLITINAGKDFSDEQYMQMYLSVSAGLTDRQMEALLAGAVSYAWLSKYRRGKLKPNEQFKAAIRAAADDMPPPPMEPAEAVRRHAHPDAAVYTMLPEGELGSIVTISGEPPTQGGSKKPCNPGCKRFAGVSVGVEAKAALQAHRERLGLTWEEMFWLLDDYLKRGGWI